MGWGILFPDPWNEGWSSLLQLWSDLRLLCKWSIMYVMPAWSFYRYFNFQTYLYVSAVAVMRVRVNVLGSACKRGERHMASTPCLLYFVMWVTDHPEDLALKGIIASDIDFPSHSSSVDGRLSGRSSHHWPAANPCYFHWSVYPINPNYLSVMPIVHSYNRCLRSLVDNCIHIWCF